MKEAVNQTLGEQTVQTVCALLNSIGEALIHLQLSENAELLAGMKTGLEKIKETSKQDYENFVGYFASFPSGESCIQSGAIITQWSSGQRF